MKYFKLASKYIGIFIGALLFGLAASKLSSARRGERKAGEAVRDLSEEQITIKDATIDKHVDTFKKKQAKAEEAKRNAVEKLDKIADKSNSVKSLLDEYNRDRMHLGS